VTLVWEAPFGLIEMIWELPVLVLSKEILPLLPGNEASAAPWTKTKASAHESSIAKAVGADERGQEATLEGADAGQDSPTSVECVPKPRHQRIIQPPSISMVWPVMKEDASEARKATRLPMSSGVPRRLMDCCSSTQRL
jgi:hypothetical protein